MSTSAPLVATRPSPPVVRLAEERPADGPAVTDLIDRAFGPGRYAKVSERLREGNRQALHLSFCAFHEETLIGAVRQWPLLVGEVRGVFLGPIAVEERWRKHGVGGLLIERCCEAARRAGERFILLVGDMPVFGGHGFSPAPPGSIHMPSPVDPRRILRLALTPEGLEGVQGSARIPRN